MSRGFKEVKDESKQYKKIIEVYGKVETIYPKTILPIRADKESAGYDFSTPINVLIMPGETKVIWTNVKAYMEPDEVFGIMSTEFDPIFIFIPELDQFINMIYRSENNMSGFFENMFSRGRGNGIYFFADLSLRNKSNAGGYPAFESFIGYRKGIHLGGKTAANSILNFEYIPFSEQNRADKAGTGYIPDVTDDKNTSKVIIPLVKKTAKEKSE